MGFQNLAATEEILAAERCKEHSNEIEAVKLDLGKTSGKYTAMLWFIGIAGSFIGSCLAVLLVKTTTIESLLSDNRIIVVTHTEQIGRIRDDVIDLKDRLRRLESNPALYRTNVEQGQ